MLPVILLLGACVLGEAGREALSVESGGKIQLEARAMLSHQSSNGSNVASGLCYFVSGALYRQSSEDSCKCIGKNSFVHCGKRKVSEDRKWSKEEVLANCKKWELGCQDLQSLYCEAVRAFGRLQDVEHRPIHEGTVVAVESAFTIVSAHMGRKTNIAKNDYGIVIEEYDDGDINVMFPGFTKKVSADKFQNLRKVPVATNTLHDGEQLPFRKDTIVVVESTFTMKSRVDSAINAMNNMAKEVGARLRPTIEKMVRKVVSTSASGTRKSAETETEIASQIGSGDLGFVTKENDDGGVQVTFMRAGTWKVPVDKLQHLKKVSIGNS